LIAQQSFHAQKQGQRMGDPIHALVSERMDFHAISLECRILDQPVVQTGGSAFTMSNPLPTTGNETV